MNRPPECWIWVDGAAPAVGGDRMGSQEIALQSIHNFYIISEMIPVGCGLFGANLGGTFWSRDRMVKALGVVMVEDIPKKG